MRTCETCTHWQGSQSSYAAPCALASYPGRVAFDMTCEKHSGNVPAPELSQQSQARGITYQQWQQQIRGTP